MESYSYNSYPESGGSSPRSREIDFENPPPWEDTKVKVMCSYGGKIHPRPHDNQLSYIGGETKILAVDRNIKFPSLIAKLSALCDDVSFKYQLPGEDLDALISVTNDDDLEHMMHEYDRQCRASTKPARLRLFLFPLTLNPNSPPRPSFGSDGGFVEALNSGPAHERNAKPGGPTHNNNNVDFLFGMERGGVVPSPLPGPAAAVKPLEFHGSGLRDDRVTGSDPVSVQAQLQRLQIKPPSSQQQQQPNMYPKRGDENSVPAGGYAVADPVQKMPAMAMAPPRTETLPPGNWIEKHMGYEDVEVSYENPTAGMRDFRQRVPNPADLASYTIIPPQQRQQNVYMQPFNDQAGQGYYVQRTGGGQEMYREQPVYNMVQMPQPQQQHQMAATAMVSSGATMTTTDTGARYNQHPTATMAYDSTMGRQVYYAAQGGVMQQQAPGPTFQGMGVGGGMGFSGGDMIRSAAAGGTSSEAVAKNKVPQTSV